MSARKNLLTFTYPVKRSSQRFRELVVYVSHKSEGDSHFGAVKLNKILYYSDFAAFERFGTPLTGMSYFRLKAGPAPRALLPIRNELVREGAIRIDYVPLGNGLKQHRTVALRPAVLEHFTADEIQLVDDVIRGLWAQNASEVSDASHDIRWRVVQNKDVMPYEFAFLSDEPVSQKEIERTRELAERFNW